MNFIRQADFARLHSVSRKTVTTWKKRGYIELSGKMVDVDKSNAKLAGSGRGAGRPWPQTVTYSAAEVVGNDENTRIALLLAEVGPQHDWIGNVSAMVDPYLIAELLLRHLPRRMVRPLVAEYVARSVKGASGLLVETGAEPPARFASWADHPWFNPVLTEDDWAEYEEIAKAHMAGADV